MTIFYLLIGIVIAATCFGTILWCVYQAVQQVGWRRYIHIGYIPLIMAGFIPALAAYDTILRIIGILLLATGIAFVIANRWPTILLVIPPTCLALAFILSPDIFAPVE
ncbi:MAG: hypothetical protein AAF826_06110 [Pseudomonadota bacterium]